MYVNYVNKALAISIVIIAMDGNSHYETDNIDNDNDNRYHNINDYAQAGLKSITVAYYPITELNYYLWYR